MRFDGVLDRVTDGGAIKIADPDEPYWRLSRYLSTMDPKALERQSVNVPYPLYTKHSA